MLTLNLLCVLNGFQLSSDFWAYLEIISATPSVCCALRSASPEYSSVSPVATLTLPDCVHRTSLRPRTFSLYFLISDAMIDVFPVWYIDLTFHVPILVACLSVRKPIGHRGSFRLGSVILLEGTPLSKTLVEDHKYFSCET